MAEQESLLPCPFCGGPVELERATDTFERQHGLRQWWGVVCRNTINRGGSCAIEQRPSASVEAAIERWNRRAIAGTPPQRKEPHEGALVGDQIPPLVSQKETSQQTGESSPIVGHLNNLEQAALDAYNEHFYKCSPSCSVATWTSAWRKGIAWYDNMPGQQSIGIATKEQQP